MFKKRIILFFAAILLVNACHSPVYNQTENNVADVKLKAAAARKKSDQDASPLGPLVVKQDAYVDTTPIGINHMPEWLNSHIVIRGDQLPFSYYSRTIANGAGRGTLVKYQVGLDPSINVTLNYSGTVKGALDLLASKSGYVYSVQGNKIYWQAFVTRTFDVAFMPGGTDYLMGNVSSGGGSSSNSSGSGGGGTSSTDATSSAYTNSEYSNLSGKLSIWTDLDTTIRQLLSSDGKVTVSQSTTTVTVRDRPTNVELVSQYIGNLNKNLSRQVLVKIQILEVELSNDYQFGINWQLIASAFNKSPFVLNGNYGTPVTISPLTPQPSINGTVIPSPQLGVNSAQDPKILAGAPNVPSYIVLLNALSQQGKTSIVSEPRVVCLNNQVSVIRIVEQEGYVASVQNTTLASGGTAPTSTVTSQVTPGSITTGLTLYILPKILNDKVYMQVNADLSTNKGFTTFPGSNQVQLPNVTLKHFNQRSMMKSGDTLVLSGFRQVKNIANANQLINSQALGGKGAAQTNGETVVLITPMVLPSSGRA